MVKAGLNKERAQNFSGVPAGEGSGFSLFLFLAGMVFFFVFPALLRSPLNFSRAPYGLVMLASMGVLRPFTGGNEAEWTRYLEAVLKSERDQLNAILNTVEEGVAIIGSNRKILFINPSLIREFGEGTGAYCYKHLYQRDEPCEDCRLAGALNGQTEKWEWTFADGRTFDIVYTPFTDADQAPCSLATFINITRRKQFELELVKLNELKSELLTQKTNQLEEISREVTKLEEEKRNFVRFLGVVAHDLKSPLTVSQSMLWEILGGYSGPVNNDQKDILERITRRIDGLLTLIDDLMDIPFIETGQLVGEMKHISMGEVIKTSVDGFSSLASEKGLKLELTLPPGLSETYGSSRRLQQVMNNLLSNAIKYSRQGTVSVRVSEDDKDIKVEVSDNGIGISSEDLPRLFQDFSRGKNIGEIKGTGLGLSISRRIVEAHGGRIWAESPNPETNTGSRFTFTLPKDNGITVTITGYGKF